MIRLRATWAERTTGYVSASEKPGGEDKVRSGIIVGYVNVDLGPAFETRAVIMEGDRLVTVATRWLRVEEE